MFVMFVTFVSTLVLFHCQVRHLYQKANVPLVRRCYNFFTSYQGKTLYPLLSTSYNAGSGWDQARTGKLDLDLICMVLGCTEEIQGVQVHRPFIYGTEAVPFDPANRPKNAAPDHTHSWKVFVRGINNEDISYWLKRVQFKLHETYSNSLRMVEGPPFEVEETGWGEFEIAIKFYFVPESTEKAQTIWHGLKLHPYGDDIEGKKERREIVKSICYEEVMFNEPVEQFYDILTGGGNIAKGKGSAKAGKVPAKVVPTAEIPERISKDNVYSREQESKELDRLGAAIKTVESQIAEEKKKLIEEEAKLAELEKTEARPLNPRKR